MIGIIKRRVERYKRTRWRHPVYPVLSFHRYHVLAFGDIDNIEGSFLILTIKIQPT